VLKTRRAAAHVAIQARRIAGAHLSSDVRHNPSGHVGRVSQEQAKEPQRAELQREADAVAITTALGDQSLIGVVEEEEPLQLRPRRRAYETAVGRLTLTAGLRDHDPSTVAQQA